MPSMMEMNRKLVFAVTALILIISISAVVAQETGFFIDITNSFGNLNTTITNSTVVENMTLTNGTLNIYINADNISTVTINGINYTAQPPSPSPAASTAPTYSPPGTPTVVVVYHGENIVPEGMHNMPTEWIYTSDGKMLNTGDRTKVYWYSWNLTLLNFTPVTPPGGAYDEALRQLVPKYPQLITRNATDIDGKACNDLTLWCDGTCFSGGNFARNCVILFAHAPLSSDEISALTQDLNDYLTPVIIKYYS